MGQHYVPVLVKNLLNVTNAAPIITRNRQMSQGNKRLVLVLPITGRHDASFSPKRLLYDWSEILSSPENRSPLMK